MSQKTNTKTDSLANNLGNVERTYTAEDIAKKNNVTSATVRTRWYPWIAKVAPENLLKNGKAYTQLASDLFSSFSAVAKADRPQWVIDSKEKLAAEWSTAGVIDCEIMPPAVGETLALMHTNYSLAADSLDLDLSAVNDFILQLSTAEANFSEAELRSWQIAGQAKAIAQFKTEELSRAAALNQLRQQRISLQQ